MVALKTNSSRYFTRVGNHCFSDICDFGRTNDVWRSLKVTQLKIQPLEGQYTILDYGHAQFSFLKMDTPVLLTGKTLADQINFGCVLHPHRTSIIFQENMISSEMIFVLDADQTFQIILQPESVLCIFQLQPAFLEEKIPHEAHQVLLNQLSKTWHICLPEKPSKFKGYLASLYHQTRQISVKHRQEFESVSTLYAPEDFILLLDDIFSFRSNASRECSKPYLKNLRRAEMVYEAVAVLRKNLHKQIRIEDLSKELNVSKRSLSYGFKEIFGIGPIKFLKIERLQHVRRALKEADPEFSRVIMIVEHFGIYSPGHFAKDYKQMFGETPSETLKRQP